MKHAFTSTQTEDEYITYTDILADTCVILPHILNRLMSVIHPHTYTNT